MLEYGTTAEMALGPSALPLGALMSEKRSSAFSITPLAMPMDNHLPVPAEDLVSAVRRDRISPDGDTRQSLRDDMFGTEPGQNERAIAFAKAMAHSTADHDRRVIEMSAQIAKVQAKALVAACRTGDRELVKRAWAVVGSMDEAYNIALQLALSLAVLTEDVGPELDQDNGG